MPAAILTLILVILPFAALALFLLECLAHYQEAGRRETSDKGAPANKGALIHKVAQTNKGAISPKGSLTAKK